jgi:hypothetical protein
MIWFALLFLFATPFWEAKAPADWSDTEVVFLLTDSPWAQAATAAGGADASPVHVYFATAVAIQQAEAERDRRFKRKRPGPAKMDELAEESRVWMEENRATQIVIAIPVGNKPAYSDQQETRRMEQESEMTVGRKKYKMTGYFPPSASDPYLRLAFPRKVGPGDKTITFELYIPGADLPYRTADFSTKDMTYKGKPDM